MNQSKYVKNLSKREIRFIAKMRGINVNQQVKLNYLRLIEDKITYRESPFKSIIQNIRNKLSKNGNKLIKKGFYHVEEMKKLTESQVKNIKEKLIKFQNELIRRNRIKNDIMIMIMKKDNDIYDAWYYGGITYNGIKDIRYLFNEDEDEDVKDIGYLFDEDEDEYRITYKESPFKSIIADIRNKISKNGNKMIKKDLYYVVITSK